MDLMYLTLFQNLERLAKAQLPNNIRSHKGPPFENIYHATALHFRSHLSHRKVDAVLDCRFHPRQIGVCHACR